jgi:hypothetical protein
MRNTALLMVTLAAACSANHVLVAALDDTGGAHSGGSIGSAGNSSLSAIGGSSPVSSGGSHAAPDAGIVLTSGGSNVDVRIGEDAGATSVVICACADGQAAFCGSDGMTYPNSCEDGGTCVPPMVACWHACPCLEGESASNETTFWFPEDCAPTTVCEREPTCLTIGYVTGSLLTFCSPDED